ncbi:alpha/beta fold hydrolase [Chelativorans sp. YIM 93263]|uniref:alpha/beta fold hydrolase n=1 Tax=Chelativorans sp. YIM 93263 TaxID=2906648 RepID=UPI002378D27A|nr:alpha/beta fold hydrolase [Chelativorans sp. YIM 93263]
MAHWRARGKAALAICLGMTLLLTGGCWFEPSEPGAFYQVDANTPEGPPGTILRIDEHAKAPDGARAWRVLYRSIGLKGEPIAVSGVIFAPADKPQGGKRPVVAWAHGTTGVANRCAPSLSESFEDKIPGLKQFLERGYVVAATDYSGLGTPGPHPYLIGVSEGRAVLDSVRAATRIEDAGAAPRFIAWGHSQGGHAALYTGQMASSYAADLELAGVAAAAPATDLSVLLHDDWGTRAGKVFTAFALWSWHRVFGAPLDKLVSPSTVSAIDRIAEGCLEGTVQGLVIATRERAIDQDFLQKDLTETEPWRTLLLRNSPKGQNTTAPLYLLQGTADQVINPRVTRAYAQAACGAGQPVRLDLRSGLDHMGVVEKGADKAIAWIISRLEGSAPATDCNDMPTLSGNSG